MDAIDNYRNIIREVLTRYSEIPYSHGDMKCQPLFDSENGSYLLMTVGWDKKRRFHGCIVHVDILDGKYWIQRDGTEYGIANELIDSGIPRERIVLAFHPPNLRKYTDFGE